MPAGTQSHAGADAKQEEQEHRSNPEIFVCESRPGRSIFLEAGNSDGWISTDVTTDVIR